MRGLPFCLEKPIRIPTARLVANNLCEKHNPELSPVDAAGGALFEKLKVTQAEHSAQAVARKPTWFPVIREIDGRLLERWLLKTLINIAWHGDLPIGAPSGDPGTPTPELVEIAFGRRVFAGTTGLRFGAILHETVPDQFLEIQIVTHSDGYVASGLFMTRGIRFGLVLRPEGLPPNIGDVVPGWRGVQLAPFLEELVFEHQGVVTHRVRITWPDMTQEARCKLRLAAKR